MTAPAVRILVVEDSPHDAELAIRELRRAGIEVEAEVVFRRDELMRALEGESWDVVLGDYSLPGFSGTEALELVRAHDPELPFIFVSGTIGEERAVAGMRAGARDYVLKGNLQRLPAAVERELREARHRRLRRRAEDQLRVADATVQAIIDASPIPILSTDRAGRVRLWNRAAEEVFGWRREEVIGQPAPIFPSDDLDALQRERTRVLEEGASVVGRPAERLRKDGSRVSVRVSFAPTVDAKGARDGVVALLEDVTESKKLEAQLLQAQKLEAVGRLAGGVAHDFNNLLTVIMGLVHFLLHELPDSGDLRDSVAEIQEAARSASMLTRQLLTFSRKELVEARVVDVNDVVEDVENMLRRLVGEDIALTVEAGQDVPKVLCDPGQLEQVVMNLLVNARDAMPDGGDLEVRTSGVELDGETASELGLAPGEYAVIAIRDTGTGIPPEDLAKIFDPFFTTKRPEEGTGLGLSTCARIVRDAGGGIDVDSEVGVGSVFRVHLPRTEGSPAKTEHEPEELPGGTETILVVEDDDRVRAVAERILSGLGYTVLAVDRGADALMELQRHAGRVDLLLTDVVLPGMGGRETAEKVREMEPELPVLFMSGYTEDVLLRQEISTRDFALLQKPFTPGSMARKVREVLDGR